MAFSYRSYNRLKQDNFPKETNEVLRNTDRVKEGDARKVEQRRHSVLLCSLISGAPKHTVLTPDSPTFSIYRIS